jgi:hypothetical protein
MPYAYEPYDRPPLDDFMKRMRMPTSQADCPEGTKFKYRTDEYGQTKGYCGEPESQADCGEGMTFYRKQKTGEIYTQEYNPAQCIPNDKCEKDWEALNLFCATKGADMPTQANICVELSKQTKADYIKSCKEKYGIKETSPLLEKPKEVIDKVTTALKPQTEEAEYRTWIVATIIGVGLYLILSSNKSAQ